MWKLDRWVKVVELGLRRGWGLGVEKRREKQGGWGP